MFRLFFVCLLFLALQGCRFSISADKLQLSIALDQAAYLSDEDPTTYTDEPSSDLNPVRE